MLKIYFVAFVSLVCLASCSYPSPIGCTPFGVRLFLGRNFFSPIEDQIFSIWFNTRLECQKSYVTIQKKSSIKKTYCDTRRVAYNNYSSYVHRCSISQLQKGQSFQYQPFGWTGNVTDSPEPYSKSNMRAHIIDDNEDIKMLVLADWGYLQKKANQYDRLDKAMDYLLKSSEQPDLICLGGDYGYDLSTNNGRNYQNFLIMLSQISASWPCIFITGNHEYYTKNDLMLFNTSFQLYNLLGNNVTSLNLGRYTLVLFDPNQIFFHNGSKTDLFNKLSRQLQKSRKDRPIVVASHYPLTCSWVFTYHCTETLYYIEDFFQLMIDYNVILYIGAHFHSYERLYPFFKGNQFKKIMPPYSVNKTSKYLISIVEGIAGNDELIVQFYLKIMNFTAAVSYNRTGYGIMDVGQSSLKYQHYKAQDYLHSVDEVVIKFDQLLTEGSNNQLDYVIE